MRNGPKQVTVKFGGVTLLCDGTYYRGFAGDRTDPPEPECFEFFSVKHCGEDVYELLHAEYVDKLEEICIEELKVPA